MKRGKGTKIDKQIYHFNIHLVLVIKLSSVHVLCDMIKE